MDKQVKTIKNHEIFKKVWQEINDIFEIRKIMPQQVFKKPFHNFLFEEFDWAMTSEFWENVIEPLSSISNDNEIIVGVLDPDPINYFYKTFRYYDVIILSTEISGKEYWNTLNTGPKENPADAIFYNSEVVVWIPQSKKWAIWGERSYGVCILGFADGNVKRAASDIINTWHSAQEALDNFISLSFKERKTPEDFIAMTLKNYTKSLSD